MGSLAAPSWTFLTNHARVLLCIAHDPGVRLRDIAARLNITERTAYGIVTDLADYPPIGQWLGPVRVDCHQRRIERRCFEAAKTAAAMV